MPHLHLRTTLRAILVLLPFTVLPGCPGPDQVIIVSVTVSGPSTLQVGQIAQFTATVTADIGTASQSVAWTSTASNVATIDGSGLVTALAEGVTTLVATSTEDPTRSSAVTLTVSEVRISVEPASASVDQGATVQVTATVTGSNNTGVTWSSSAPAIATVSGDGLVTGRSTGATTITATALANSTKSASSGISVADVDITASVPRSTIDLGGSVQMTAVVLGTVNQEVSWRTSNDAVALVDSNGRVTGVASGSSSITATSVADPTKSFSVTITVGPVELTVTPSNASVGFGGLLGLSAVVTGAVNTSVTWASSNLNVATVSSSGVVTGVLQGVASITATSMADPSVRGSATITVTAVQVSVVPSNSSIAVGGTVQLTANVSGAANRSVSWTSGAPGVASVDANGLVRGFSAGVTSVTATSVADPTARDFATVTVTQAPDITIIITNELIHDISITANGTPQGIVPAGTTAQTSVPPTSNLVVDWDLMRQQTTTGEEVGENMSGFFTRTNPGSQVSLTVDATIGTQRYFAPLIENRSGIDLLMAVNFGLTAENRCSCTVPNTSPGTSIGYYRLFSNSNVRAYRPNTGYTGNWIFWNNFFTSVDVVSGALRLIATFPPAAPPATTEASGASGQVVTVQDWRVDRAGMPRGPVLEDQPREPRGSLVPGLRELEIVRSLNAPSGRRSLYERPRSYTRPNP